MKIDIRLICLMLQIATLSGCAVSPTRMTQTYNSVEIQLSSPDKKGYYYLVGTQGRTYGLATGASGTLMFHVPADAPAQECYTILNAKGKSLLSGRPWFYLSIRPTYQSVVESRNRAQRIFSNNAEARRDAQSRLDEARSDLSNNRAWNNDSCEAPAQGIIPLPPTTSCGSREELRWMNEFGATQAESDRQYQSCTDDQVAIQEQSSRLEDATTKSPWLEEDVTRLDLQLRQIEAQQAPLAFCIIRSVPVRRVPGQTYIR